MRTLATRCGLCHLLLMQLLLLTPDMANSQPQLTIFWYIDDTDLIPGKTPDVRFGPSQPPYGTQDPVLNPNEKDEGGVAGNTVRGSGFPAGTNVNQIKWDPKLEITTKNSAEKCDGGDVGDGSIGSADEIVVGSTTRLSYADALTLVRVRGAAEYDVQNNRCKKSNYPPCDQYRLLMTASFTGFACSRAHCPDTALPYRVHCRFSPTVSGTGKTGPPYIPGVPCQKCPRDRGYCYNGLCVSHEDKVKIQTADPNSKVACDAPCENCGQRKDEANECKCHCPTGYGNAVDCSVAGSGADPNSLPCGPCARAGRPCQNGGIESGEATCRCLCPENFKGQRCEFPLPLVHGGPKVPLVGPQVCSGSDCGMSPPDIGKLPDVWKELKPILTDEINKFCQKNQANYEKCCGAGGVLPTSGNMDFLYQNDVHALTAEAKYDANGQLVTPIYAVVRGNNGLCRKTTDDPNVMVPVPPGVLIEVIGGSLPGLKAPCCGTHVPGAPTHTVKDDLTAQGISDDINCMVVTV